MTDQIQGYASVLQLSREDIHTLKVYDAYSLHRVVYGLFPMNNENREQGRSDSSGFLYADDGEQEGVRQIIMVSRSKPHETPQFGKVKTAPIQEKFFSYDRYAFEIMVSPSRRSRETGKVTAIKDKEDIARWFTEKLRVAGAAVGENEFQVERVSVQQFQKKDYTVTHGVARLRGVLTVVNRREFADLFFRGIGRGKAFGLGLLKVSPFYQQENK